MSKTTVILSIVAVICLIVLAILGISINQRSVNESSQVDSSVNTLSNQTDAGASEETTTDSSVTGVDKTLNFFISDQSQETSDFDDETTDKSQIKVDSQDLLNLSQSYETSDF